jgi:hypothetical protein
MGNFTKYIMQICAQQSTNGQWACHGFFYFIKTKVGEQLNSFSMLPIICTKWTIQPISHIQKS